MIVAWAGQLNRGAMIFYVLCLYNISADHAYPSAYSMRRKDSAFAFQLASTFERDFKLQSSYAP